jgi:hypothetical protein
MGEGKFFNINTMLKNLFQSLDKNCERRTPNLVFVFSKTVPCQLKGEVSTLYTVLFKTLKQVIENECSTEVLIYVDAPEEFLYREKVSFSIANIPVKKEKIMPELQKILSDDLKKLDATLEFSEENGGSLKFTVPLTNAELGCRRHYRLPSKSMLDKNILLIVKGNNLALALTRMFKYFPMNVDVCINSYKERYALSDYDLVLIEDSLFDSEVYERVKKAQNKSDMQFVLLGNSDVYAEDDSSKLHTAFLEKPVTQESVFKLLLSLFDELPTLQP